MKSSVRLLPLGQVNKICFNSRFTSSALMAAKWIYNSRTLVDVLELHRSVDQFRGSKMLRCPVR